MVNAGRTLLLNLPGLPATEPGYPGEQYVDPSFTSVVMSPELAACRQLLFSGRADRAFLNWRAQELLTCIHASGLADYLKALDPRISYWPFTSSLFTSLQDSPIAVQRSGPAQTLQFVIAGPPAGPGDPRFALLSPDRIYWHWQLSVDDASNATVTLLDEFGDTAAQVTESYTIAGHLSSPVALPGSAAAVVFGDVYGTTWDLKQLTWPPANLASVDAEAATAGRGNVAAALFPANAGEPYQTFADLWYSSDRLTRRLAGLTLAVIYRLGQ